MPESRPERQSHTTAETRPPAHKQESPKTAARSNVEANGDKSSRPRADGSGKNKSSGQETSRGHQQETDHRPSSPSARTNENPTPQQAGRTEAQRPSQESELKSLKSSDGTAPPTARHDKAATHKDLARGTELKSLKSSDGQASAAHRLDKPATHNDRGTPAAPRSGSSEATPVRPPTDTSKNALPDPAKRVDRTSEPAKGSREQPAGNSPAQRRGAVPGEATTPRTSSGTAENPKNPVGGGVEASRQSATARSLVEGGSATTGDGGGQDAGIPQRTSVADLLCPPEDTAGAPPPEAPPNPPGETPLNTAAGEKPAGEKPAGEKPAGEKPAGEKPAAEKPAAERRDAPQLQPKASTSAWDSVLSALGSAWGGLKNAAGAVFEGIGRAVNAAGRSIEEAAGKASDLIKDAPSEAWQGIRSAAGTVAGLLLDLAIRPPIVLGGGLVHAIGTLFGGSDASRSSTARPLNGGERSLLLEVFGDSLDYNTVTVKRGGIETVWDTSRTVANTISLTNDNFTRQPEDPLALSDKGRRTLVHEMTHVWQYQHSGLGYMAASLGSQLDAVISHGNRDAAYEWNELVDAGVPFERWNPEQQAQAVGDYYALTHNLPVHVGTHRLNTAESAEYRAKLAPYAAKVKGH
jgi:hypothetical protein